MALTPAEKQKRYRERQKEALGKAEDQTRTFLRKPFFEYLETDYNWDDVWLSFDLAGLEPPSFTDDRGPMPREPENFPETPYEGITMNSIGRAEVLVGSLLDAATAIAATINNYKTDEIKARIAEIEQADLSDPKVKARALRDIVILQGIKAQLEGKTFRRSFAEISVKGSVSS